MLSVLGLEPPDSMDGVDLSPLLDGRRPPRRRHRTASYTDHVCAADGRWLLIADNHGRDKRLYRLGRERRDLARSHPKQVRRLWRLVLKDAGTSRCRASRWAASRG